MKFRAIPQTDLIVSEVGFALSSLPSDEVLSQRLLRQAYDHGINLFDATSTPDPAFAESCLAKAFPIDLRSKINIVQSFSGRSPQGHGDCWCAACLEWSIGQSCATLDTEWIDIIQLSNPPAEFVDDPRVAHMLERLRRQGRVRAVGLALGSEVGAAAPLRSMIQKLDVNILQTPFDLFDSSALRWLGPLLDRAADARVGFLARASNMVQMNTHKMQSLWQDSGRTQEQAALQFSLSRPWVSSAIVEITPDTDIPMIAQAPMVPSLTEPQIEWAESA